MINFMALVLFKGAKLKRLVYYFILATKARKYFEDNFGSILLNS